MSEPMKTNRRKQAVFLGGSGVVLLLLLLWLRGCGGPERLPQAEEDSLLVPRDLARRLDRAGILDYCRKNIQAADYPGILRGAHGALWAGQANAWDRALLAAAALQAKGVDVRILPGDPPRLTYKDKTWLTIRLDSNDPGEESAQIPATALKVEDLYSSQPGLFHQVTPVLILEQSDGSKKRVPAKAELVVDWAYQPVILSAEAVADGVQYVLSVGSRKILESGSLTAIRSASLEFAWQFKGKTTVWARELFHRANAEAGNVGRDSPRAGDRYAIVLAAGPLVPEVLHTRTRMLESEKHTPLADAVARELVLLGTKYQIDSDERSLALAKETQVSVSWTIPRITIAASETSKEKGNPGLSLDTLADAVEAKGEQAQAFQFTRGLVNDLIETRVIFDARKMPVVSATTIMARQEANNTDTPERRIARIRAEAERLLASEPTGTRVVLTALPAKAMPVATSEKSHSLTMLRTPGGLALLGLKENTQVSQGNVWDRYSCVADSPSISFSKDAASLAVVADVMLSRQMNRADYVLECAVTSAWPLDTLPVTNGSVLMYRVQSKGKENRLAVFVGLKDGVPEATWVDVHTNRSGMVANAWPAVLENDKDGPTLKSILASPPVQGPKRTQKIRVGDKDIEVPGHEVTLPQGMVTVLASQTFPLVLSMKNGDTTLVLESASPVIQGRVIAEETKLPIAGAIVTRLDQQGQVTTAADGSFVVPPSPMFRRLILILDRSGSMAWTLDPKYTYSPRRPLPPADQQRIYFLRKAVHGLLDRVPPGVEVTLWSFTTKSNLDRDFDSPRHTKVECPFTTDLGKVRKTMDQIKPNGGTPINGSIIKLLDHVDQDPLSQNAVVVLMSDGENSNRKKSAAQFYKERKGKIAVHTIGFAIEAKSTAEKELRELAEVSGGSYRLAGTAQELRLAFAELGKIESKGITLRVNSSSHEQKEIAIPKETGLTPVTIQLKPVHAPLLTIGKANVSDLKKCEGLSPRARKLIEDRVRDGLWEVTIPSHRTNIGSITAYGWFERELSSGRLVGRTEDGLHGSVANDDNWPKYTRQVRGFIAWYQGVVAYTSGSVDAAFRWGRETNYKFGSPDDFKHFVQANALKFALTAWMKGGANPAFLHGVATNFSAQTMAFYGKQ